VSIEGVALFHYILRSREDFMVKMARGHGGSNGRKTWTFFEEVDMYVLVHVHFVIIYFLNLNQILRL
jgi:hypothetical protein